MIQQLLVSTGMVVLVGMINQYGSNGTAVFGIAIRVDQLAFLPAMTIGMAVSTLAGQNIGAQRYDRVKQVFNWGILLSGGITLTIAVLANLFPRLLLRLFVQDQTVINMGVPYLRIMSVGYLFISVFFVSNGIINGSGYTYVTTLISIFGLWIVRIPLASYFSHSMHRLDGIWYAIMISMGISMILSTAYYLSGYWKKPLGIIDPVDSIQEII
jgi:Na+-driven multidrug efflux pump